MEVADAGLEVCVELLAVDVVHVAHETHSGGVVAFLSRLSDATQVNGVVVMLLAMVRVSHGDNDLISEKAKLLRFLLLHSNPRTSSPNSTSGTTRYLNIAKTTLTAPYALSRWRHNAPMS